MNTSYRRATPALVLACAIGVMAAAARPATATETFPAGTYSAGEFSVQFDGSGNVRFSHKDELLVSGEFKTNGDQIRFTDKSGSMACLDAAQKTGVYRWKYAAGMLSFTKLEDRCDGRAQDLTAQPWKAPR